MLNFQRFFGEHSKFRQIYRIIISKGTMDLTTELSLSRQMGWENTLPRGKEKVQ